jgi:hypothetical protein
MSEKKEPFVIRDSSSVVGDIPKNGLTPKRRPLRPGERRIPIEPKPELPEGWRPPGLELDR